MAFTVFTDWCNLNELLPVLKEKQQLKCPSLCMCVWGEGEGAVARGKIQKFRSTVVRLNLKY